MQEVKSYRLDLVGLASTHSIGSRSKLLGRGWTLLFSRVAKGVRRLEGVGILTSHRLSAAVLEFTLVDKRVTSICLRAGGESSDCCLCVCTEQQFGVFLGGPDWGPAWDSSRGLRGSTGRL